MHLRMPKNVLDNCGTIVTILLKSEIIIIKIIDDTVSVSL